MQNTIRQQLEAHAAHIAHIETVRVQEQQEAKRKADEADAALRQIAEAARISEQQEAQRSADVAAEAQRQAALKPEQRQAEKIAEALQTNLSFATRATKHDEPAEQSITQFTVSNSNTSASAIDEPQQTAATLPQGPLALNSEESDKLKISLRKH